MKMPDLSRRVARDLAEAIKPIQELSRKYLRLSKAMDKSAEQMERKIARHLASKQADSDFVDILEARRAAYLELSSDYQYLHNELQCKIDRKHLRSSTVPDMFGVICMDSSAEQDLYDTFKEEAKYRAKKKRKK